MEKVKKNEQVIKITPLDPRINEIHQLAYSIVQEQAKCYQSCETERNQQSIYKSNVNNK